MKRFIIMGIALFVPVAAGAAIVMEDGHTFTHYGSFDVIVREAGDTPGIDEPHIEIECEPTDAEEYIPSVHPIGTPEDARYLARILWIAADAAEGVGP